MQLQHKLENVDATLHVRSPVVLALNLGLLAKPLKALHNHRLERPGRDAGVLQIENTHSLETVADFVRDVLAAGGNPELFELEAVSPNRLEILARNGLNVLHFRKVQVAQAPDLENLPRNALNRGVSVDLQAHEVRHLRNPSEPLISVVLNGKTGRNLQVSNPVAITQRKPILKLVEIAVLKNDDLLVAGSLPESNKILLSGNHSKTLIIDVKGSLGHFQKS